MGREGWGKKEGEVEEEERRGILKVCSFDCILVHFGAFICCAYVYDSPLANTKKEWVSLNAVQRRLQIFRSSHSV
jgi:hypothetical protein